MFLFIISALALEPTVKHSQEIHAPRAARRARVAAGTRARSMSKLEATRLDASELGLSSRRRGLTRASSV
eukprot:scaffold22627_cov56-Phaeocystis_antarctica.AAC.2